VLGQVGVLAEALATERAGERLFAGVRPDMHVHAALVLEALATDAAVVQGTLLALHASERTAGTARLLLIRVATGIRTGAAVAGAVGELLRLPRLTYFLGGLTPIRAEGSCS